MCADYFYGEQAEQFTFYRVPKILLTDLRYREVSTEAKVLYGILLDRMGLSAKNHWVDEKNRVFIYFTIEEVMEQLQCAEQKAVKLMAELEKKAGLVERKRQGLGKPNRIYLKNFISCGPPDGNIQESQFKNCENHNSGAMKITTQELRKSQGNNTDINNTENSDTDRIYPGNGCDPMAKRTEYREYFEKALELDLYRKNHPYHIGEINEIEELMIDVCCSTAKTIRISGDDKPGEVVKGRFMKMDSTHLDYVLECFLNNTTEIRNIRQYLLATLYNATMTIDSYYTARVKHDMYGG